MFCSLLWLSTQEGKCDASCFVVLETELHLGTIQEKETQLEDLPADHQDILYSRRKEDTILCSLR